MHIHTSFHNIQTLYKLQYKSRIKFIQIVYKHSQGNRGAAAGQGGGRAEGEGGERSRDAKTYILLFLNQM